MIVKFWGVRGSYPVPGVSTNKYGGNTPCVEVRLNDGTHIILDAGTGIRELGQALLHNGFGHGEGATHLLVTHTHWDHIQGLPHFAPAFVPGNRLSIYSRRQVGYQLRDIFAFQYRPDYSSVSFSDFKATLNFVEVVEDSEFKIGTATIRTVKLNHPSVAIGYRIDADGGSFAYVTDTAPFDDLLIGNEFIPTPPTAINPEDERKMGLLQERLLKFLADVHVMVYDTFFRMEDYKRNPHWGHSTVEHGMDLCLQANVSQLVLFHHAPSNTDDVMDRVETHYREKSKPLGIDVRAAMEGLEIKP